ncbi:hypothetical protein FWF89_02710 [Candidatus Saccharibacteria bacterium]|nr:hypothetical protein [Candidatus Saccharibacteria bacterium]
MFEKFKKDKGEQPAEKTGWDSLADVAPMSQEQDAPSEWDLFVKEEEEKGDPYANKYAEELVGTTNTVTGERYETIEQAREAYMKVTREVRTERAAEDARAAAEQAQNAKRHEEWLATPEGQEAAAKYAQRLRDEALTERSAKVTVKLEQDERDAKYAQRLREEDSERASAIRNTEYAKKVEAEEARRLAENREAEADLWSEDGRIFRG